PPLTPPTSTLFPYTTLFRSTHAGEHFVGDRLHRRHIVARRRRLAERARDAGVGNEHTVIRQHHVLRLQLAMRDLGGVRVRETARSEEHTSELQSPDHLVCRL